MAGKRKTIVKRNEPVKLDGSGIDRISALTVETLTLTQTNQKDIVRLRLSIKKFWRYGRAIWEKTRFAPFGAERVWAGHIFIFYLQGNG